MESTTSTTQCALIVPLHQNQGTCWLNAVLMCILFSQGMRAVVMESMSEWDQMADTIRLKRIYHTIRDIVLKKYHAASMVEHKVQEIRAFASIDPQHIAGWLHSVDPKAFKYSRRDAVKGGVGELYVRALLSFLRIRTDQDVLYVDCVSKRYYRSRVGISTGMVTEAAENEWCCSSFPKVLVVMYDVDGLRRTRSKAQGDVLIRNIKFEGDEYTFTLDNDEAATYVVDSIYFGNFDTKTSSAHAVAGVTCNDTRFVYNGWTHIFQDNETKQKFRSPCKLMLFDWMSKHPHNIFCINQQNCDLTSPGSKKMTKKDFCFDPQRGSRVHFAVRKDVYEKGLGYDKDLSSLKSWGSLKSPHMVHNPATKTPMSIEMSEYNSFIKKTGPATGRKQGGTIFSMLCGGRNGLKVQS